MTARLILKHPNPKLRITSLEVDNEDWVERVEKWCTDIKDTMKANAGLGLAAPQVDIHKRIFAVDVKDLDEPGVFQQDPQDSTLFFINPEIKHLTKDDSKSIEACLSVPGVMYPVKRSSEIVITYTAPDRRQISVQVKGEDSVVLQHEYDHLNGKLFIDRLNPFDRKEFMKRFEKPKREKSEGEINQLREQKRAQTRKNRKK